MIKFKRRPAGGYFVFVMGEMIGWVTGYTGFGWRAYHNRGEGKDGLPIGTFNTRREAAEEVWIWRESS